MPSWSSAIQGSGARFYICKGPLSRSKSSSPNQSLCCRYSPMAAEPAVGASDFRLATRTGQWYYPLYGEPAGARRSEA